MREDIAPIFDKDFVHVKIAQEMEGFDALIDAQGGGGSGFPWMVILRPDLTSVIEALIPLTGLAAAPKPGDRWGAQFCRNLEGYSTWSFMYDFSGFRCPQHFGTLVFE